MDSRHNGYVVSAFAQDEVQVRQGLIVNAGIRYDHFNTFGGTLNPRAAVIFQPQKLSTYKFLYGEAFRAPNAYENFYETVINKPNPDIGPETIRSYEAVYEQQLGRHWRATTSLFYNDIQGLLGYRQDPVDSRYFFDNLDAVVAKGGEFELEGQGANGLRGRASYTYTRTRDDSTRARLSNSPQHLGKLGFTVPLQWPRLHASVELHGMSARDTVIGTRVGSTWLTHVTLFSRELARGLEVSASVYNLFDRRYSDPVATDFIQGAIEQDGRSFRVKLTWYFAQ